MPPQQPLAAQPHSNSGTVVAVFVTLLIVALVLGGAHAFGFVSLNTAAFVPGSTVGVSQEEGRDVDTTFSLGGGAPTAADAVPEDLERITQGLEEIAETGESSVPLVMEAYGNTTNISLEASTNANTGSSVVVRDGVYALKGSSAAGAYVGTVDIYRRQGTTNVYDLTWRIGSGQEQWGVGILQNGVLSVGYYEQAGGVVRDVGVVSFAARDGRLEGPWTSLQGGGTGMEQLQWSSE